MYAIVTNSKKGANLSVSPFIAINYQMSLKRPDVL
ncbi:hypothetical protein ERHA55_40030 [Erwinia rhapontici]|nr:hypothetical protein ERHA55_40030 [Erwinia rhapontici]